MDNDNDKTGIKVLQNVTLEMVGSTDSLPKRNSANKKRRVTSSMIYLDEEPVFSDSEEEKEYTRRVFGKTNKISPQKSPKNREAEIQCDIVSNEKTLIGLIKKCSLLNPDVTTRFLVIDKYLRELVYLCKLIQSEMREESAEFSDGSCNGEELFDNQFPKNKQTSVASTPVYASSEEFMPSSSGTYPQDTDRLSKSFTENELIPSEPFVCDEQSPSTHKIKQFKKRRTKTKSNLEKYSRRSMRERRPPMHKFGSGFFIPNQKQIVEGDKENVRKKLTSLRKKLDKKMLSKHSSVKHQRIGKITDKSHEELPKRRHPNLEYEYDENMMNMDASLNISIPKKILKSLARNWMKPNKSVCLEETFIRPQPHYVSLQHEKQRRLYSPSRWLESDDFLNSMTQSHDK